MRLDHLKVKVKSLAAEATIIRHGENKAKKALRWAKGRGPEGEQQAATSRATRNSLREHRVGTVRYEQRHSLLAYGFLRGREYHAMERTCHDQPDWDRVKSIVSRFGGPDAGTRFDNELKAWRA